jgi:excisionase family DNA binding protein
MQNDANNANSTEPAAFASLPSFLAGFSNILTLNEVAEILRIDDATARNLFTSGTLKGFKVGRQWRMTREALISHIEGGQQAAA